jgi:DNA invertase Pin-like site-specific DNA recombinase
MADMVAKGRQPTNVGDHNPNRSLSAADVVAIRRRHASGETASGLAREYGISGKYVYKILGRATWKSVF